MKGEMLLNIIKKQMAYNYSRRNQKIKYIVIHDTGNTSLGADAKAHYNYFNGGNRGSSADVFVDENNVMIVNDYNKYYSWHCGDGRGKYGITNANSIGIEICINQDGNFEKAVKNTVEFVKGLMEELNINTNHIVRHYDASRKNCPQSFSKNNWKRWEQFKEKINEKEVLDMEKYQELRKEISVLKDEIKRLKNPVIYNYIDDNMPQWAKPTVKKLVDKNVLKGDVEGLNLTEDLMRMLVINDRIGIYE